MPQDRACSWATGEHTLRCECKLWRDHDRQSRKPGTLGNAPAQGVQACLHPGRSCQRVHPRCCLVLRVGRREWVAPCHWQNGYRRVVRHCSIGLFKQIRSLRTLTNSFRRGRALLDVRCPTMERPYSPATCCDKHLTRNAQPVSDDRINAPPHRDSPGSRVFHSRRSSGALLLGVALGGLFDGILLHQVLQWHHLLSLFGSESLQDIRTQVLADGLFRILMYALACAGLWLLWSGGSSVVPAKSSKLIGMTLLGFGVWQLVDVAFFHWILRIHRSRVDVANPLFWDIGWILVFGLPALALAYWLLAARGKAHSAVSPRRATATL